ncbi:extracellular solute-binding protein [bacterium]|nr:extracellular solute-binding protein [bacterium]
MTPRPGTRCRHRPALRLIGVVALGLLVAAGAVPAAGPDRSERVTFTSALVPSPTSMEPLWQAERAVVRAFLREYPNYVIEPFQMPAIQGAGMDTRPLMGIASGNPPHVMLVNFRQSASYINHGFLVPIEILLARVMSEDPATRETDEQGHWRAEPTAAEIAHWRDQIRARVAPPVWPVINRRADVRKKGIPTGEHVWAIPVATGMRTLLYRKDVFKAAGLDPERPPRDWDELLAYARQIKTRTPAAGLFLYGGPYISWGIYSFLVSNGVRFMGQNEDGEWHATFNTPAAAEAIHFVLRLVKEQYTVDGKTYYGCAYVPATDADVARRWNEGLIGMQFQYLDHNMMGNINPELVGIAPTPVSPRGTRAGEINCRMLGVFRNTTPAQQLAIMRYIWFVTGEEAQRWRTKVYVENGFGRFVNPALLKEFGYDDILRQVPPGWQETFQTTLNTGVPEPYGKNTQFIYHKVSEPINWALQQPLLDLPRAEALKRIEQTLDDAARRVDKFTLGKLTPAEWAKRRWAGGTMLVVVVLLFAVTLTWVWRAFSREERLLGDRPPLRRFVVAYLMILPAIAVVVLWQYLPVMLGAPLALFDYELVIESVFVGIDNFATVLYDARFWASLSRTFYYVLLVVGLGFWPPILVAILLDEVPTATLKYFFRTIFYLPAIVSGIIMVFLWRQLYEPSESGFLNQILMLLNHLGPVSGTLVKWLLLGVWLSLIGLLMTVTIRLTELSWTMRAVVLLFALALLGVTFWPLVEAFRGPSALEIEAKNLDPALVSGWNGVRAALGNLVGRFRIQPLGWTTDPGMAMLCVVIPGIWAAAGPGCIIYLAALKTVPEELVEAASIDGAGILQKLCYITLPRIKFLILIQLVGAIVGAFKGGANFILAMTGGGPNGATRVLGMDIFERTFMELQYGVGTAMAWILGGLVIVLTAFQLRRMSRAEFKTAASVEAQK